MSEESAADLQKQVKRLSLLYESSQLFVSTLKNAITSLGLDSR